DLSHDSPTLAIEVVKSLGRGCNQEVERPKMKVVLAPNRRVYEEWRRANHLGPRDAMFIDGPERLRGLDLDEDQVVRLEGCESHPDYPEMLAELLIRTRRRAEVQP
ncbi:MAG: hypothetical protein KGR26_14000, partial [Cyanobacteria bacterium REEB65]|nr:hypothetical protein [Cyanobacteria bacterium REEB65]